MGYVQFVVNSVTKVFHDDSVRFAPDSAAAAHPYDWTVVCDGAGKIVVRARGAVIGIAAWRDGALRDPKGAPDRADWELVERCLRPLIDQAAKHPNAFDPGELEAPPVTAAPTASPTTAATGAAAPAPRRRISHFMVAGATLVAGIVVMIWKIYFGLQNGRECHASYECASHNCYLYENRCEPKGYGEGNFINGSTCHFSTECASGNCYQGTCYAR